MTLDPGLLREHAAALREANLAFALRYPGDGDAWQPVHTLIEGAQHFTADVSARRGAQALQALDDFAADAETLGHALGIGGHPSLTLIADRVREKLSRQAVEDYRIDFEDGFGVRSDAEEDDRVAIVAAEIARGVRERILPPSIGIRIKPLTEELRERSVRTLDLLVRALVRENALPPRWALTVPKITVIEQVDYIVAVLAALERSLGIPNRTLRFEIMVEVPQVIIDATGTSLLPRMLDASDGRLTTIDFGTYDYTAACGITAAHQRLRHPACDFAKHAIQVAFAGTGVRVADGSTSFLPVPIHAEGSASLSETERGENAASVQAGWRMHFEDVRHSLAGGFYQGWDLHAAQLVSRYAAVTSFYLEGVDRAGARLRAFLDKATNASLVGGMMDEPATGQGLLGFFLRGISAGAITLDQAAVLTGLSGKDLGGESIIKIMRRRGITAADYLIPR